MKVICPKCQFENQADSSRVVCARCATIVEVRLDQGTGFDSNGKRQTARLPFASNSPSNSGQPLGSQPFGQNSQPFGQNKDVYDKDVYATRLGDDFDDVLDVPGQAQTNYSTTVEPVPIFEDVFVAPSQDQTPVYDFSAYEKTSTTPIDSFATGAARQRQTQDYAEPSEPEFMGWPVLPENSADEEEAVGNNRGGVFTRIGLIVGVFGVLCFLAYYFLGDFIAKRKDQANNLASANSQVPNPGAPIQSSSPIPAPSVANNSVNAAPSVVTPKPQESVAARNPNPNQKQVSIPPIPAGRDGHSQSKPAPPATQQLPSAPNKGNLTVQVGSFKDQGEADARATRLRSAGVEARVVRADIPGKGAWFRVQVSSFPSREAAMSYGSQLRSKKVISDFIVTTK
ncbi:MAG: SPOR domain-containing protein [Blastocatellales bacterium]